MTHSTVTVDYVLTKYNVSIRRKSQIFNDNKKPKDGSIVSSFIYFYLFMSSSSLHSMTVVHTYYLSNRFKSVVLDYNFRIFYKHKLYLSWDDDFQDASQTSMNEYSFALTRKQIFA